MTTVHDIYLTAIPTNVDKLIHQYNRIESSYGMVVIIIIRNQTENTMTRG